jgi:hypothetical protein
MVPKKNVDVIGSQVPKGLLELIGDPNLAGGFRFCLYATAKQTESRLPAIAFPMHSQLLPGRPKP